MAKRLNRIKKLQTATYKQQLKRFRIAQELKRRKRAQELERRKIAPKLIRQSSEEEFSAWLTKIDLACN